MLEEGYVFPRPKIKPIFLSNETPQSLRVMWKFTDEGLEIIVVGRHERTKGEPLASGQRIKMEEEDIDATNR